MDEENVAYTHSGVLLRRMKLSFVGKWMELEIMMLSKISQTHKDSIACFLPFVKLRESKTKQNKTKNQVMKIKAGLPGRWKGKRKGVWAWEREKGCGHKKE
jgi:hypothetical protein